MKVSEVKEGMDEAFLASASCSSHPTPGRGPFLGWDFSIRSQNKGVGKLRSAWQVWAPVPPPTLVGCMTLSKSLPPLGLSCPSVCTMRAPCDISGYQL